MSPYKTKTRVLKSSKRKMTQKMRNMRQKKIEINYDSDLTANNPVLRECSTPYKIIFDDNPQQALSNISDLNISEINNHILPLENENCNYNDTATTNCLEGRRIVDIKHLFKQIQNSKHGKFDCSFLDMEFKNEIRKGYNSVFYFKCKMCGTTSSFTSENQNENKYLEINQAIVNGTLAIGIGYTQLSEFSASAEIPALSSTSYIKILNNVSDSVNNSAIEEMKSAGEEERRIALERGNVDDKGVLLCTVIADGQWSKRSYKTKLNAFSGAAAIIGLQTKKVLFIGIRNRYCCVCQRARTKKEAAPSHLCFLNWSKSSTSMESDAIVEGFLQSVNMHGLKYNKLIGDGDSSVTKKINEVLPYGSNFQIKKIECRNHLLRNYCTKMMALTKRADYPINVRKCISNNILRFRSDVTKAMEHHLNTNLPVQHQITELRKDIENSLYHRLG
ncbi:uncharacterized protein LOC126903111 [Daktulosphaira vitifoliae]|uniref:uncharacterized protein LOC126903111 n=1 Tax=Daktulosphaira vitifoliae TaxID=58002 RepID=UPI0021A9D2C5|nr:uncharacterized protein LOC126903111 [Daktulosphaira vitifoliae]